MPLQLPLPLRRATRLGPRAAAALSTGATGELARLLRERRAARSFAPTAVPDAALAEILRLTQVRFGLCGGRWSLVLWG